MMAIDPGALDAAVAACVGDDPALIAELRAACLQSLDAAVAALTTAVDDAGRAAALDRIEGLAASFGATRLLQAARRAKEEASGPAAGKVVRIVARLKGATPRWP